MGKLGNEAERPFLSLTGAHGVPTEAVSRNRVHISLAREHQQEVKYGECK